jgi:outer membrane lipoprotein-sorting protein
MRKFLIFVAALFLATQPAFALTEPETAALKKAEGYLNGISTLQARFVQVNPDGSSNEGDLYISRPGKMRLAYDPPTPMLMVADGVFLIYVDTQMKDVSHIDLGDTPAGLLLKKDLAFTDPDIKLSGVKVATGTVEITAAMAKDATAGRLTLVFTEAPFELKQWRVVDAQRKEVVVTLDNIRLGGKLDPNLFKYDARKRGQDRGDKP